MKTFKVDIYQYTHWKNRLSDVYKLDVNIELNEFISIKPFEESNENSYNRFKNGHMVCFKYDASQNLKEDIRYNLWDMKNGGGWHYYSDLDKLKKCFKLVKRVNVCFELNDHYKNSKI